MNGTNGKSMVKMLAPLAAALVMLHADTLAASIDGTGIAEEFEASGDYSAAALEYRRMEAEADPDDTALRGALLLSAARDYFIGNDLVRMGAMLDKAENDSRIRDSIEGEVAMLRMIGAEKSREWASAAAWGESLADTGVPDGCGTRLRRAIASDWLLAGDCGQALEAVGDDAEARRIIGEYRMARPKSPRIGGILGIVPGMGYAYSGEWGNMARSVFLNGIFGWAMYETASRDEWGLFAVTTFFEATWFTGSIYGGIDAAHRHNREATEAAARELRGGASPDLRKVDVLTFRLEF